MKNKLLYATMFLSALSPLLYGCDNDDNNATGTDPGTSETPLVLKGKTFTFDPQDKGSEWESEGKKIGVFMTTESGDGIVGSYENMLYQSVASPIGYFSPLAETGTVIYYPEDGSKTNLIAYYPYQETLTGNKIAIDVSNQESASSPFNLLYSSNLKGIDKNSGEVEMELRPALSQIVLKLEAGSGVTADYLQDFTATVKGMYTKADFNLVNGQFENPDAQKDITMKAGEATSLTELQSDTAQVIPVASVEGYQIVVNLPKMGREHTYNLSDDLTELKQATRYTCTATVTVEGIDFVMTEEPIGNWEDGNTANGSLKENWIERAIDELPVGTMTNEKVNKSPETQAIGNWFFSSDVDGIKVEEGIPEEGRAEVKEENGEKYIYCHTNDNNTWYRTFVAYRMRKPLKQKYNLKFKIKGTKDKRVDIYTYKKDGIFIVSTQTEEGKYNGHHSITLTEEWKEYTCEYDFAKYVGRTMYNTPSETYSETTDDILENLLIQFSPWNNFFDFYLKDVSLELKKEN